MNLRPDIRGNIRFWLKGYLFIGIAILILGVLVYSNHVIGRMREQTETTTRLFAHFIDNVTFEADEDGKLSLFQEVMHEIDLPIIITVLDGRPVTWQRLPVEDSTDEDDELIQHMDPNNPPTEKIRKLIELVQQFDRINRPIPVKVEGVGPAQAWVHYGTSTLERELRYTPLIQLGLFLLFMGIAVQGYRYLKISEQRSIWVGMAKETAHQLGTPLSALLGWTQLLKDQVDTGSYGDVGPTVNEMEVDLERLGKITERFSKIGSRPDLVSVDVNSMLERTMTYFHRRLPRLKADSTIILKPGECPPILGNEELLEWVFENLIKNGLDALGDGGGSIEIRPSYRKARNIVDIFFKDTGRGIPTSKREQIFQPGFTTKKRGWGLGLALTRRIVEDYHDGSLKLMESSPGKGTTFVVRLPADSPTENK